jgi:hypothetical protein
VTHVSAGEVRDKESLLLLLLSQRFAAWLAAADVCARRRCPAMPLNDHDAGEHIAARAEAGTHDVS